MASQSAPVLPEIRPEGPAPKSPAPELPDSVDPRGISPAQRPVPRRRARAGAVLAATLTTVVVAVVLERAADIHLQVPDRGGALVDLAPVTVALTAALAGIMGWALLAVLENRIDQARRVWTSTAAAVCILSFAGPLTAAGLTASQRAGLVLLHVCVAATLVPLLRRTAAPAGRFAPLTGRSNPDR